MDALLDSDGLPVLDSSGLLLLDSTGLDLVADNQATTPGILVAEPASFSFVERMASVLPTGWFADVAPVLSALLEGAAAIWGAIYAQIVFVRQQTRIATATGVHLDMASLDYLGGTVLRRAGESETAYSSRIRAEIIRPRVTRAAIIQALQELTGRSPKIVEPALATDTGGIGHLGMTTGTGLGIGVAGAIGSLQMPFQLFVTAYRGGGGGMANVMGIYSGSGPAIGGIGSISNPSAAGAMVIASLSMVSGQVTDTDIYDAVTSVMPAAAGAWVAITN